MRKRTGVVQTGVVLMMLVLGPRVWGAPESRPYVPNAYHEDHGRYPAGGGIEEAVAAVRPAYMRSASSNDAWGTPDQFTVAGDGSSYTLVSAGSDGTYDPSSWSSPGEFADLREDALLKDGEITRRWN